jgi:CBS domain containing-hemolysin-like protein
LARSGDDVARLLYKPAAYGVSLTVLLGGLTLTFSVLALVCLVAAVGSWLAVLTLLVLGALGGLLAVPSGELNRTSLWLAKRAAPGIAWLLERLQPVFEAPARLVQRLRPARTHTGLYEKSDLAELLEAQKSQPDNRIAEREIELLKHSLNFGDKLVADSLVPKRTVKLVAASDTIGPVLMDELARSGHSRFPVYDGKRDHIVGILYLQDLAGGKRTGKVNSVMHRRLSYVHEEFTLYQALQAFLTTKQHLFLVINSAEELVGIITIEDVLGQMIGQPAASGFEAYDDPAAVAAATTPHEPEPEEPPADLVESAEPAEPEAASTTEATEVVE